MLTPNRPKQGRPRSRPTSPGQAAPDVDSEQGSIVMAMLVLLVLAGLTAGLLASSQSSLRTTALRARQDEALGGVDVAIAEATARIELGEVDSFTGTGSVDSVQYRYTATRDAPLRWTVAADAATVDAAASSSAAATAQITGVYSGTNPYALFTVDRMHLGIDNLSISEPLGTNGTAMVSLGAADLLVHTFGAGGTCTGCSRTESFSPARAVEQPATPPTSRSCPLATLTQSDGTTSIVYLFEGTVDGQNGVPFRCAFDDRNEPLGHRLVIVRGTVNVENPPLIIHVDQDVTLWFLGADVNPGGNAGDVTVQAVGGPSAANGHEYGQLWDDGLRMIGVLNAPMRELEATSVDLRGQMIVGSLDVSGGSFSLIGDPIVVDSAIEWTIGNWQRTESP